MNCEEARRHWEIYYDSEGDSELYLAINDHLSECHDCARWFFQQAQFEETISSKLATGPATVDLWQRVLTDSGIDQREASKSWMFFSSCLALAASLLVLAVSWSSIVGDKHANQHDVHLSSLTAVAHEEFTNQRKRIDFTSRSDLEVEEYLKSRVPFPVRCPPREDAGFSVRGGGVCKLGIEAVAYVVGEVEDGTASIFILPEESLQRFSHERKVLSREQFHHCREGKFDMVLAKIDRNLVVVIGQASPQQLERVVRAYGTYPERTDKNAFQSPDGNFHPVRLLGKAINGIPPNTHTLTKFEGIISL